MLISNAARTLARPDSAKTIASITSRTLKAPYTACVLLAPAARSFSQHHRMSSGAPSKEWMVYIPDHPNALQKRLEVRPEHLKGIKPHIKDGLLVMGGASLSQHPGEGQSPDMTGSFIVVHADSKEKVVEFISSDVYTKSGVWDVDKAQIWPFKSAIRTAL